MFLLRRHDTALAECSYRLVSTLIMFWGKGMQEIWSPRWHSHSPGPGDGLNEPEKMAKSPDHFPSYPDQNPGSWNLVVPNRSQFFRYPNGAAGAACGLGIQVILSYRNPIEPELSFRFGNIFSRGWDSLHESEKMGKTNQIWTQSQGILPFSRARSGHRLMTPGPGE